jgi:hypothetical protein
MQKTHEANSFACTNIPGGHHIILIASLPAEHANGLALTLESPATENSALSIFPYAVRGKNSSAFGSSLSLINSKSGRIRLELPREESEEGVNRDEYHHLEV